jgi:membrane protease YdiL (CAAX protease family)
MPEATRGVTGFQIAFFVVALLFLAAPADKYLFDRWQWAKDLGFPLGRTMLFVSAGCVLLGFPALRRRCLGLLSTPIPSSKASEMAGVMLLHLVTGFAAAGVVALWTWNSGGEPALARLMGSQDTGPTQLRHALSLRGITTSFLLGGLIAPVIEELVFRGLLYPAWAAQWGWVRSALATSTLFAVLHPNMYSQFMASLLYICLFRRTGSLRAAIVIHATFNILMWYPLIGQFLFPSGGHSSTGELSYWTLQIACLALALVALPVYMWMSRDARAASPLVASARTAG